MLQSLLPAAALLALAACSSKSASNEANHTAPASAGNAASPESSLNQTGVQNDQAPLPPADRQSRFVGIWASSKANCTSKPWRFTIDELSATDGPHCHIYNVSKVPGGYDLAVQCPAKKPDPTDLIKLRFAESAMLVESNAIAPMGLIYCGK